MSIKITQSTNPNMFHAPSTPPRVISHGSSNNQDFLNRITEKVAGMSENPVEKNEKEPLKSSRFAELAKQEAKLRQRELDYKARSEAEKERNQALEKAKLFEEKLKKSPLEALSEVGFTKEQLLNLLINGDTTSPTSNLEREIEALKLGQEAMKKEREEYVKKQYEDAISNIRHSVKDIVATSDEFSTIRELGMEESVVDYIKDVWEKEKKLLSNEEAARKVEEHLINEAMKYAQLNKVKSKLMPQESILSAQEKIPVSGTRTLSNSLTPPATKMSARDRAIARLTGQPSN